MILAEMSTTTLTAGGVLALAILTAVFTFLLKFRNHSRRGSTGSPQVKDELARREIDTLKTVEHEQWSAISHLREDQHRTATEIRGFMERIDERTANLPCVQGRNCPSSGQGGA